MSAEDKNKLDDIFKQGLGDPDTFAEYDDQDWDDMEQLLDAGKPTRGIVYWMRPVITGMAALLLLALGFWFFKSKSTNSTNNVATVVKPVDSNKIAATKIEQPITAPTGTNPSTEQSAGAESGKPGKQGNTTNGITKPSVKTGITVTPVTSQYASSHMRSNRPVSVDNHIAQQPVEQQVSPEKQEVIANNNQRNVPVNQTQNGVANIASNPVNPNTTTVGAETSAVKGNTDLIASANTNKTDAGNTDQSANTPKKATVKKTSSGFKPQFGMAMLLAPDVNGVGSFQNAKVGENVGLLFSVGITKKLTISTGAAYSKKPYEVGFADYHVGYKFKTDPANVYADCRVLDIPINVDYRVYKRSVNSFSIGAGLSSYIMLRETYNYNYADPATVGPASFTVVNRNQHILGVMNLNATYEHQLNNKFSIAAQPFLKIPLTDIGNSQVRLQSAGLALGVRWNINNH